jgi:hypothetical protein
MLYGGLITICLKSSGYVLRARAGFSASSHRSRVKLSKITNVSNHITRRIQLRVGQAKRGNHPVTSTFGRSQSDKNHLIFVVIDYLTQSGFQFNLFRRIQVALEHGELQMVAEISTGFKHLSQSLVIRNIVAN